MKARSMTSTFRILVSFAKHCVALAAAALVAKAAIPTSFPAESPRAKKSDHGETVTRKRVMGACFVTELFDGNLSKSELRRQYEARLSELTAAYGTDAYNGTLTTTSGCEIEDRLFDSRAAAEEYVANRTQKWEAAVAVRFKDIRTEVAKAPTFNGKDGNHAIFAAVDGHALRTVTRVWQNGTSVPIAADGLTTSQKAAAIALYNDYETKARAAKALQQAVSDMLGRMTPAFSEPPTAAQLRELQKAAKQRLKASNVAKKASDKLIAFDNKHTPKIYATKQVDHGTLWLVGGWAAE